MVALAPDFIDPDWYDRQESYGEWLAFMGEPDVTQDEFWTLAQTPSVSPAREEEVEF